MAKKSAKSKGFRRQQTKKPYLSRREVAILCVIAVVLVIVAILAATYSDGALKVVDGKVSGAGDNWLIVNGGGVRTRARYFKVGEAADIEGYTRANNPLADENVPQYVYTPEAEDAPIDSLSITTSHAGAKALAEYIGKAMATVQNTELSDISSAEFNGQSYFYSSSITDLTAEATEAATPAEETENAAAETPAGEAEAAEATEAAEPAAETESAAAETPAGEADAAEATEAAQPAEEAEADGAGEETGAGDEAPKENFRESFSAFVDCAHESCVVIDIHATAETREALPDDEAMLAIAEQAIAAVTLEPVK